MKEININRPKTKWLSAFGLSMFILATSQLNSTQAALISIDDPNFGPGSITSDSLSGLEWLDLTKSQHLSVNDVIPELGVGGQFEGFRYATSAELVQFIIHAGIPNPGSYANGEKAFSNSLANASSLLEFMELVGTTFESHERIASFGLIPNVDPAWQNEQGFQVFSSLSSSTPTGALINIPGNTSKVQGSSFSGASGHWLVRVDDAPVAAQVPDHSYSLSLLMLSLVSISTAAPRLVRP